MSDPKELRSNAQDCLKQVRTATSAQDKVLLLNMAHAWLKLSQQVEQLRAPWARGGMGQLDSRVGEHSDCQKVRHAQDRTTADA